ncbi:MAG: histidine kinase dimerization/phospho-acceptor domain-containing protein [Desulforhopalus sp.]
MKKNQINVIDREKIFLIIVLVTVTTILHFTTKQSQFYYHIVLRELYFLPIVLGAFWYGVRGGLFTSLGISSVYTPLVVMHWQGFSPEDLDKFLEIILFNVVAIVMGILSDREKAREREKQESILAMAGTIAHELNTPLQVVLGGSQLLQDDFEPESTTHKELQDIINNTRTIQEAIKKISQLDQFVLKKYAGDTKIIDISS